MMMMLYAGSRNGRPPNRQSLRNLYNRLASPSYTNILQPFVDVGILDFAETWHAMIEGATSMVPAEPANMCLEQEVRKLIPITAINWRKHFEFGLGCSWGEADHDEFIRAAETPLCSNKFVFDLFGLPPVPIDDGLVAY